MNSAKPPEPRKERCPHCNQLLPVFFVRQEGTPWGGVSKPNWFVYLKKH